MHLESQNREAFELVTGALECIDKYRASRDVAILESAKAKLTSALQKDPGYFRASYFDAIVDDLVGNSKRAAEIFARLAEERPPFLDEVRYNLGVAEYHQYNHEALDRAIRHFSTVIKGGPELPLRLLARAGLAQAHAMHMIPKRHDEPNLPQIEMHFQAAMVASDELVAQFRRWFGKPAVPKSAQTEIRWAAHNARGMALMYYTDYFPQIGAPSWLEQRIKFLKRAISELEVADGFSPNNWANYCDMASARMRLAYYEKSEQLFQDAIDILEEVTDRLRPGYPFAMYELGRIHRLRGNFAEATRLFAYVLSIPYPDKRDISDRRPTLELGRAAKEDRSFP